MDLVEKLYEEAQNLFDGTRVCDNPEYLRGMSELIARCLVIPHVSTSDRAEMVADCVTHEFDRKYFHDYVVAHGFGSPTEQGYYVGWELMKEGDDIATASAEVTARGLTFNCK